MRWINLIFYLIVLTLIFPRSPPRSLWTNRAGKLIWFFFTPNVSVHSLKSVGPISCRLIPKQPISTLYRNAFCRFQSDSGVKGLKNQWGNISMLFGIFFSSSTSMCVMFLCVFTVMHWDVKDGLNRWIQRRCLDVMCRSLQPKLKSVRSSYYSHEKSLRLPGVLDFSVEILWWWLLNML